MFSYARGCTHTQDPQKGWGSLWGSWLQRFRLHGGFSFLIEQPVDMRFRRAEVREFRTRHDKLVVHAFNRVAAMMIASHLRFCGWLSCWGC